MEEDRKELIILEQLPIITSHLENLSVEIKKKVDNAISLVCTPENYKEIKEVRTNLNKEFQELEKQRKAVKNAVMGKYNEFENIYKEKVSNLYQEADTELKKKIDESTYILVKKKEDTIREFAEEHIKFNHLENIIKFEDIPLNINLSCSVKSLQDNVLLFVKHISDDLECISSDENRDELLYEYQHNGFNYTNAVMTIRKKLEEISKLREQQEKIQEVKEEEKEISEVVETIIEEIVVPKEIEEKHKWTFTFEATETEAKEIKEYLESRGVKIL